MEQLHAFVTGQVQGVGFRYFVKRYAEALSLTGFVRNLPEGQVEVLAEGSAENIAQLTRLLEIGPSGAIVVNVEIINGAASGQYTGFQINTH